ncbi:MAG TPA: arylesterase, partial [Balneolaceae bacterium]|nr:arylesterase [Balneolaceae bacterium]
MLFMIRELTIALILLMAVSVQAQETEAQTILFFGDSITAGLGVQQEQAFPALVQDRIDSLGMNYEVINGGLSGETSAGGLRRIDWILRRDIDLMVLELGGNDGLRGIDLSSTKENLQKIIEKFQAKNPNGQIILAGMQVPPNLGQEYTSEFQTIYPELAE